MKEGDTVRCKDRKFLTGVVDAVVSPGPPYIPMVCLRWYSRYDEGVLEEQKRWFPMRDLEVVEGD